jgi:hypothetical protein
MLGSNRPDRSWEPFPVTHPPIAHDVGLSIIHRPHTRSTPVYSPMCHCPLTRTVSPFACISAAPCTLPSRRLASSTAEELAELAGWLSAHRKRDELPCSEKRQQASSGTLIMPPSLISQSLFAGSLVRHATLASDVTLRIHTITFL